MGFTSFDLPPDLMRGVTELGFTQPTVIQEQAIPPALSGRDLLACAATGAGRPRRSCSHHPAADGQKPRGTTRALILTPTRELAAQIHQHLEELAVHTRVTGAAIYGGVGMGPQEQAFRKGVDILIATPGRLLDHLRQPYARLDTTRVLVLDEADRMLDMGFLPDIRRVLQQIPARRQTLFFSATMPPPIVKLSQEMLRPLRPSIWSARRRRPSGITQAIYPVPQELKSTLRRAAAARRDPQRDRLPAYEAPHQPVVRSARAGGYPGGADPRQPQPGAADRGAGRLQVREVPHPGGHGHRRRGIDVEALEHVVNFDVPAAPEDYIHRVGRTARAEAIGDAVTFVSPDEEGDLRAIERRSGAASAGDPADFDYRQRSGGALRGADRRADRRDPRAQVGGAGEGAGQDGARRAAAGGGWRAFTILRRRGSRGGRGSGPRRWARVRERRGRGNGCGWRAAGWSGRASPSSRRQGAWSRWWWLPAAGMRIARRSPRVAAPPLMGCGGPGSSHRGGTWR
jgi:ATP-dependent RNA helicase RhlE